MAKITFSISQTLKSLLRSPNAILAEKSLVFLCLIPLLLSATETEKVIADSVSSLYRDLSTVKVVNDEIQDHLPFNYNHTLMGGYLNMPSARMAPSGTMAVGFASATPFHIYSLNFQMFSHLEMSGNYRIVKGRPDSNFGHEGFGDHADRQANVKLRLLKANENDPFLPSFAIGFDDFHGSGLFNSFYVVSTKQILDLNLELTLGWGKRFIDGFFGGAIWTPFRKTNYPLLKNLSLIAEWDPSKYREHTLKEEDGLSVKSRLNVGLAANFSDIFQVHVSSFRGNKLAASAALSYGLGESKGFFPKTKNPSYYDSPVNYEPLGIHRAKKEFAAELAHVFSEQGFNLSRVYLMYTKEDARELWIKVINLQYRKEEVVRTRVQNILASLVPSDVDATVVTIESDGIAAQSYRFSTADLRKYAHGTIPEVELAALSPMQEASSVPGLDESLLLYRRRKDSWTFTLRPRLITFFGSVKGKFKYTLGFVGGPEGYLFDNFYYRLQAAYNINSSASDLSAMDRLNPSQLPQVRSDTVKYFQSGSVSLEQFYLQKGWNCSKGSFFRLSTGYFEPAYGGLSAEYLFYPVQSNWAIGLEAAGVLKRDYRGLGFTTHTTKFDGFTPKEVHYIGYQYFLDLYYIFNPLQLELKASLGQFLARDRGVRFELTREYSSGMRFSLWYTFTTANDLVNGKNYNDKGIAFFIPFDFFLKKSSRTMLGYAMSEWLRDTGARAATGKRLFRTLRDERL